MTADRSWATYCITRDRRNAPPQQAGKVPVLCQLHHNVKLPVVLECSDAVDDVGMPALQHHLSLRMCMLPESWLEGLAEGTDQSTHNDRLEPSEVFQDRHEKATQWFHTVSFPLHAQDLKLCPCNPAGEWYYKLFPPSLQPDNNHVMLSECMQASGTRVASRCAQDCADKLHSRNVHL